MAEKPSAQACGNGAIDAHKKKAAAHFLIKSLEKKISGEHLLLATAQAPPLPSLYYPPKGTPSIPNNGSPPSITKSENAAHPYKPASTGSPSLTPVATRRSPPRRPSPQPSPKTWRTQLTQSERGNTHEPAWARSVRPPPLPPRPAPLPFASEPKPSPRDHCPLYKSKSESPPAPPNKALRPLQQNGTDLTHSHVSDLSSCKRATSPKADASSNSCTKQVRVEEARESPDGQFFSSHVSPLQRRRSHSYSSDDAIQRQRGRLRSLTPPPPSSRDTPKSPSKKRLFGFFHRSSSDQVCMYVSVSVCLTVSVCLSLCL